MSHLKGRVLAEPVLVGREKELEELQGCLDSAVKGKGTTVFISGEAGSGKTRLVKEFLAIARIQGIPWLAGWCLENASVPYFPFIEAFNSYFSPCTEEKHIAPLAEASIEPSAPCETLRGPDRRLEATDWLTGLQQSGKAGVISPQVWKDQAFAAVSKTLHELSTRAPVILLLEDIHWADSASLALLHYVARAITDEKILVLATFRSEEVNLNPEGTAHPLGEEMRLMRREDLFSEIKLSNLDQENVTIISENMIGGSIHPELVAKLVEKSNGNALFLIESLRMLVEHEWLVQEKNQWRLAVDNWGIPSKIKDIILGRLAALNYPQRRVLNAASVIGEKFSVELLASVLEKDSLEVLETLNLIAQSTSIVRVEEAFYRFNHARSREVLYEALSLPLKRGYHTRIAEKLESTDKNSKLPFTDLAYHFAQADNREKAEKYSLAAGQEALARWSNTEAAKFFKYVLQTIGDSPERFSERTTALEGLGDAYYAGNNFKEATEAFEQLARIQSDVAKLRALRKAAFAAFYHGDIPREKMLIHEAEGIATADRLEAARILKQKAELAGMDNDWVTALKITDEALEIFQEEYALSDTARILFSQGFIAANLGQLEKGVSASLRSIALYGDIGDFRSQIEAYAYAGGTLQACTLVEDSNRLLAKAIEVNESHKIWDYIRLIPAYCWWPMGLLGEDIAGSISKALKGLEYIEKTDSNLYAGAIYGVLIIANSFAGDATRVDEYFGKLLKLPKHILSDAATQIFFAPAIGVYYASKNEFKKSNQYFNQSLEMAKSFLPPFFEASSRQLFAWALGKQGKMEEAKVQLIQAQKIIETAQERFKNVNVQASLITLTHPEVNQTFEIRLDLVNVSKSQGSIVKVENIIISELQIVHASPNCLIHNGQLELKDEAIGPFKVKTVKLTVKATKPGTFNLSPLVTFKGVATENITTCRIEPVKIVVYAKTSPEQPTRTKPPGVLLEFEFKTPSAKKAFDFLISAFIQDYMRRRLPLEWSGWRTLMEIVKHTGLSRHSVYGNESSRGLAILELEKRGLIEARVFPKERGRGGKITKVRVFYEKEIIKRRIDQEICNPNRKNIKASSDSFRKKER
jgi:tetratricopeptide (TPR) repeat protein